LWPWQKTEAGEHATHTHRGQLSADAATHAHDPDERAHGDRVEMSWPSWARGNPLCLIDLCCPAGRLAYQHVHESLHRPRSNEHLNDLPCRRAPRALSPSRRCWCCFLFGSRRSQGCEMAWLAERRRRRHEHVGATGGSACRSRFHALEGSLPEPVLCWYSVVSDGALGASWYLQVKLGVGSGRRRAPAGAQRMGFPGVVCAVFLRLC
jgi:hypothetical protein